MTTLVQDIMKKVVLSIDASMAVIDAAKMMDDASVGAIVVIQENIAVGIITERDIVKRVVAKGKPSQINVKEVMSPNLVVINPNNTVLDLAQLMKERQIHRVPVVKDDRLIGMVTSFDLVRFCSIGGEPEVSKITDQILLTSHT
ncbi:MAG: signal transduction protein [Nitrosarchaeum sp.]|nr:signal transduction protein [Nitrosarchaeum sp.]